MVSRQLTDEEGQDSDESAQRMVGGGHTSWPDATLNLRQTPHLPSTDQWRQAEAATRVGAVRPLVCRKCRLKPETGCGVVLLSVN